MTTKEITKVEVKNPCVECHGEIRTRIEPFYIFSGFKFHAHCWESIVEDFKKIGILLMDDQQE